MADDGREVQANQTVRNWLVGAYGSEHHVMSSADSVGSLRALLLVTASTDHPELPLEVLEAWQVLITAEQRHLEQAQRALRGQPNYAQLAERAAADEDPSRRAEREAELW